MKTSLMKSTVGIAAVLAGIAGSPAQAEYNLDLPDPEVYAALYGDFYSYSGPILALQFPDEIGFTRCGYQGIDCETDAPQELHWDDVLAGKVEQELNVLSINNGVEKTTQPDGAEDAYLAEQGGAGSPSFSTTEDFRNPDDGSAQLADDPDTWDVNLQTFVDGYESDNDQLLDAVFVFNNNETDKADTQTMQAWFQVLIWDSTAYNEGTDEYSGEYIVFTFADYCPNTVFDPTDPSVTNICLNGGVLSLTEGGIVAGPDKDPTLFGEPKADSTYPENDDGPYPDEPDFALSGGDVCFEGNDPADVQPGSSTLINCADASPSADTIIPHNLGSDRISYMLWSPELNDFMQAWTDGDATWSHGENTYDIGGFDMLSVDLRLGCDDGTDANASCDGNEKIDNGPERAFWAAADFRDVPEPSVLALFGIGLMSLFSLQRRRPIAR